MKKSKFSLVLAFAIIIALVAPFTTYAADKEKAEEPKVTSETANEAVTTSEEDKDDSKSSDEATTEDETTSDETATEETATLEEVKGNYFENGTDFTFEKAVDGNAFLIGNNITLKGKINGDLFIIANNITLEKEGQIFGNVFMIADKFTHNAGMMYSLFAFLTEYICEYDGMTALDLKVFADKIKFAGYTERSVYFSSDNIELTNDAYILGNFVYNSNNEPLIGETATVYGEKIKNNALALAIATGNATADQILDYVFAALTLLGTVLGSLFLVNFFKPNALHSDVKFKFLKVLKALGVGILSIFVLSLIIALLFVSTVFTELAGIILTILIATLMLSSTVTILVTATMLYNKFNKGKTKFFAVLYAFLITLIYFGLSFIPYAGLVITILFNLIGFGFVVLWLFNIRKQNKVEKISAEKVENEKIESEATVAEVKEDAKKEVETATKKEETKNENKDEKKDESKKDEVKNENKDEKKDESKKDEVKNKNKDEKKDESKKDESKKDESKKDEVKNENKKDETNKSASAEVKKDSDNKKTEKNKNKKKNK